MTYVFRPAAEFTDQHGVFVALVGGTNSGKTYSALRLARGIAGPSGKIAVIDTEGGRTLHLKKEFAFDVTVLEPPHRPERYLEAAKAAQEAGYAALLIDSFTMEWRGIGGVLDWMDAELEGAVERQRARAQQNNWDFDEFRARNANKMAASIRPKMSHKLMVAGFLGLRIPIIFAIRGEMTLDPDTKKEKFKAQCSPTFLFEVTVSFRLSSEKRGAIDLSDAASYKMEGAHRAIFKNGEQLSERHGEQLIAWARGSISPPASPAVAQSDRAHQAAMPGAGKGADAGPNGGEAAIFRWIAANGRTVPFKSAAEMANTMAAQLAGATPEQARAARERNCSIMAEISAAGFDDEMVKLSGVLSAREKAVAA